MWTPWVAHGKLIVISHPFLAPLWGVLPSSKVKSGAKEAVGGRGTLSLGAGGTLSCTFWERDLSWLSRSSPFTLAAECGGDLASWVVPRYLSKGQERLERGLDWTERVRANQDQARLSHLCFVRGLSPPSCVPWGHCPWT